VSTESEGEGRRRKQGKRRKGEKGGMREGGNEE
jgi:hypothetical protein